MLAGIAIRAWWVTPAQQARRKKTAVEAYRVWLQALEAVLRTQGTPKAPDETVLQYLKRMGLRDVAYDATAVLYSGREPSASSLQLIQDARKQRYKQLPIHAKLSLYCKRFFTGR